MPRQSKGARLWLQPERIDRNGQRREAVWVVRDGRAKVSTGRGRDDVRGAEEFLATYLARRHKDQEPVLEKSATNSPIADVLAHYGAENASKVRRPDELLFRLGRLNAFWGRMTLADVNRISCKRYVTERGAKSAARRELEDLRAAVNLYIADGLCREAVKVTLPEKHDARVTYFTREQVAALLWHCWRTPETQTIHRGPRKGEVVETGRRPLRHVCRYILTAVYTGTRSARIYEASFEQEAGRPWLDLDGEVYYRRGEDEEVAANKRAGSIRIPKRLLAHMRRWRGGVWKRDARTGEWYRDEPPTYLVEYRGHPANPKKALAKAMDAVFGDGHQFVAHTFRHTAVTWLMWSGEDLNDIAAYASMTREVLEEVYGHHHPSAHESIGDAFSKGRAGRRPGTTGERKTARRQAATD